MRQVTTRQITILFETGQERTFLASLAGNKLSAS